MTYKRTEKVSKKHKIVAKNSWIFNEKFGKKLIFGRILRFLMNLSTYTSEA